LTAGARAAVVRLGCQTNPNKTKENQTKELGFAWFYSANWDFSMGYSESK
jgi:hypothetical protein